VFLVRDAALALSDNSCPDIESVSVKPADADNPPARASGKRKQPYLVSSTRSPLANPRTPIHRLAAALQSCLYFPDPGALYAVCGTVMANMMRGYPAWLMLVGPPESGKTELLKPLMRLEGVSECGDLSGKAGLLSATRAKDRNVDSTGGLLKSLQKQEDGSYRGALVMLDFARTVLAADPGTMRATLGAIGMLHDQHYKRDVGTDGGQSIEFTGRIGFLAACTDVIDHPDHQQANAEMGERCLYYRYPLSDGYHEISSSLDNPDGTSKSQTISDLFYEWSQEIGIDWQETIPPRDLTVPEKKMIVALSQLCAKGRSGVHRDRYNKNEIAGVTRSALGPRIANSLAQLLRGMERCGCTDLECRTVLMQCAMDSLPAVRSLTIKFLLEYGAKSLNDIAVHLGISTQATKRTLEDLRVHGLTETNRPDGNGDWKLSDSAAYMLQVGWCEAK
jgi:hypothetical protein